MRILDVAVLLVNVLMAARDGTIGFEDADRTIEGLVKHMNRSEWFLTPCIESALWSCNLLDEKESFWHYDESRTFKSFVNKFLRKKEKFNYTYNFITSGDDND